MNFFISTKNYPNNPLFKRVTVSFYDWELYPNVQETVKKRWDFVQDNKREAQVIKSSIVEMKGISEEKNPLIKIINNVENMKELNQLHTLFLSNENQSSIACVKKFDFSKLLINATSINSFNAILMTLSQNLSILSNLTTIVIREVDSSVTLQFPDLLNSKKIIFILNEEQGCLTPENAAGNVAGNVAGSAAGSAAKGLLAGVDLYGLYCFWFPSESKNAKKKIGE